MKYRIPQYLHKPIQVLFFDADELAMVVLLLFLAMMFGYVFWILLFVVPYVYMKIKKNYPRGALRHMLYRIGLISIKNTPESFQRMFKE
ncbi:type IV conjugative transfer system protein TraL [Thermodesulfovibrio thiophilus]|uniref:type IV conjugative transfer system protein TraL n=1 Tax=Thermodesulfovibrio thiophilus TaxID=340095 RepID=UPI0004267D6B|nr:type IV conjugative transfer system protein TraL [Thermodesulfovibrio thiophilus]